MTLRVKSTIFSILALAIMIISIIVFYRYKSMNNELVEVAAVLDEIKHSAHRIEIEALSGSMGKRMDTVGINKTLGSIPDISQRLRKIPLSGEELSKLIDVEISFARIGKAFTASFLEGRTLEQPLLEQIQNEAFRIEQSVDELLRLSGKRINTLKIKIERLIYAIYLTLIIGMVGTVLYIFRWFIRPVTALSRQVEDVKSGTIENISLPRSDDEIGRLAEFTGQALSDIKAQTNELKKSKKDIEGHYQRQVALSDILKLSNEAEDTNEFIEGTLKIILSLEWLNIESKGGIFLVEDEPSVLVLKSYVNFSPDIVRACARVPFGKCLCGRSAEERKLIYSGCIDERHEISYEGMTPHGHYCVPIIYGNELLGVIVLYLQHGKSGHPDETTFLSDVSGILSDVVVRKRLEDKQRLISTAIEQAGEGVIITDIQGNIQYSNPSLSLITGYDVEELIGGNMRMFESGRQSRDFYKKMWDTILSGKNWEGTITNKKKDGALYEEKLVIAPVKDKSDKITNFVAIKRDITKEKRFETQLLHSQKMEAVGTLAGGIAHDFNNVLTAVLGYAQILKGEIAKEDPKYKAVEIIESSAIRGADLASRILNVMRKEKFEFRIANLNPIIEDTIGLLLRSIPKTISIETSLSPELPNIKADATQLQQVIMNLVVNARDAMPEGGRLMIETNRVGKENGAANGIASSIGYVKLSISDTGKGIEKDFMHKIFDPFFTTKERGSGTGLGLYIVHSIVSNHGGYINLYSEPDKGTRFNVYFPACKELTKDEELPETEEIQGTGTVLVIDDEPDVRELTKDILKQIGYSAITASDGKEGINIYRDRKGEIDLVILDMIMPKMNGPEVFQILKTIDPDARVIIVSGYSSEGFAGINEVLKSGANGFVQKPFSLKTLSRAVRKALT